MRIVNDNEIVVQWYTIRKKSGNYGYNPFVKEINKENKQFSIDTIENDTVSIIFQSLDANNCIPKEVLFQINANESILWNIKI